MGSQSKGVNRVAIPADMLEEIAATNHLAIAKVVRLFLLEGLPEGERKLETLERSLGSPRRFTYENGALPR
jgi:hypothetical protein